MEKSLDNGKSRIRIFILNGRDHRISFWEHVKSDFLSVAYSGNCTWLKA